MKRALINIDFTNDFVAENGALTCGKPGQEIESKIVKVTEEFIEREEYVVFAVDLHKENDVYHPETKLYPPHNIQGSKGRELYGQLKNVYESNKYKEFVNWMDKTRYSAFVGTDLELKLRERGIEEVHICGVCTDICILATILDAYSKNYKLVVYKDAVASFNTVGHDWALQHFQNALGAKVVTV